MPYDIHFESLPQDELQGYRFLSFGDYSKHVGIKGVQKLVNRVIKCFMTPRGSDISDPDYGTSLLRSFQGNVAPDTLSELATIAVNETETKIREYDTQKASPTDERLATLEIENIDVGTNETGVEVRILVQNVAGTRALVSVPFPWSD